MLPQVTFFRNATPGDLYFFVVDVFNASFKLYLLLSRVGIEPQREWTVHGHGMGLFGIPVVEGMCGEEQLCGALCLADQVQRKSGADTTVLPQKPHWAGARFAHRTWCEFRAGGGQCFFYPRE